MKINRAALENLFNKSEVFGNIEIHFQDDLLMAVGIKTEDLRLVTERKLGTDFLQYLVDKKGLQIQAYQDDLMTFLALIASLNSRDHINMSDIYLLTTIKLSEFEDWQSIVLKAIMHKFFGEIHMIIDQNTTFKDRLVEDVEKGDVSASEIELTDEIVKWLDHTIKKLQHDRDHVDEIETLTNRFDQREIYKFYQGYVDSMLQHLRFQLRAFKLVEVY